MSGKQDWRTPPEFLTAVTRRFGPIDFDLAATTTYEVSETGSHFSPEIDALSMRWDLGVCDHPVRVAFLNPPFANIRPWAKKLDEECRLLPRWTLLLVPASMGSGWWRDHVLGKAMAFGIPRMAFVGADAMYPKDLALCAYGYGVHGTGYWDWRKEPA